MTGKEIRAIYPEYSRLVSDYEQRGFLFGGSLRKEVFYIQRIIALKPGECMVYRTKLRSWEAAKQTQSNIDELEGIIESDSQYRMDMEEG